MWDRIVVGAGVIGTATAYHLKRTSPELDILLLDRGSRAGSGNTSKSAALYRNVFSSPASRLLANSSIDYYLELGNEVQLKPTGYLWMFSGPQWESYQGAISSIDLDNEGISLLGVKDVKRMLNLRIEEEGPFPGVKRALLGSKCGSLSAMSLSEHYLSLFKDAGGEVSFHSDIRRISLTGEREHFAPWKNIRCEELIDRNGETFRAKKFIFATGAWTQDLLGEIGIFTGVLPKKRQLFGMAISDPGELISGLDPRRVPNIILPASGTYIKPLLDRGLMITGSADGLGQPFSMSDENANVEYFNSAIAPVLEHYFPRIRIVAPELKWAGYYAYHWPDMNPVVEQVSNILWVSGTSGSGIMKADSLGRITAAKALSGTRTRLFNGSAFDVMDLSLRERNVEPERFVI